MLISQGFQFPLSSQELTLLLYLPLSLFAGFLQRLDSHLIVFLVMFPPPTHTHTYRGKGRQGKMELGHSTALGGDTFTEERPVLEHSWEHFHSLFNRAIPLALTLQSWRQAPGTAL